MLSVAAVLGAATTASAAPSEVAPADGATITATRDEVTFSFRLQQRAEASIEVATQPTLGQDGTLAREFTVDHLSAFGGDADPTLYTARTDSYGLTSSWHNTPGVYYWQIKAFGGMTEAPYFFSFTSQVYTITVADGPRRVTQEQINRAMAACHSGRTVVLRKRVRKLVRAIDAAPSSRVADRRRKRLRTVRRQYRRARVGSERACRRLERLKGRD
jgi:hypothetical protein